MKFGDRIRALRLKRGWTQAQLAKAMDVSAMTVSRWERGAVVPHHRESLYERACTVLAPSDRAKYLASGPGLWRTPPEVLELVRRVAPDGTIALDPCTSPDNPTGARRFIVQELHTCGLRDGWARLPGELAFINTDFRCLRGEIDPLKPIYRDGNVVAVGTGWAKRIAADRGPWIAVVPCRPDTGWYGTLQAAADAELQWRSPELGSRIHYLDPDTGEAVRGATFPSALFLRSWWDSESGETDMRFADAFGAHGTLRWLR